MVSGHKSMGVYLFVDSDVLLQTGPVDHSERGHSKSHAGNQLPSSSAFLPRGQGATVRSERRHPNSCTGNQLPPSSASSPRKRTAEVQNICSQRHGRIVLSLVRELALDSSSLCRGKPTERAFDGKCHDFLVVWNKMIEVTKLGNFIQPSLRSVNGTTQETFHRHCFWFPHAKGGEGSRLVEGWSQRASIRTTGAVPQILPPAASS